MKRSVSAAKQRKAHSSTFKMDKFEPLSHIGRVKLIRVSYIWQNDDDRRYIINFSGLTSPTV